MCLYNPSVQRLALVVFEICKVGEVQRGREEARGSPGDGNAGLLPLAELAAQRPVVLL